MALVFAYGGFCLWLSRHRDASLRFLQLYFAFLLLLGIVGVPTFIFQLSSVDTRVKGFCIEVMTGCTEAQRAQVPRQINLLTVFVFRLLLFSRTNTLFPGLGVDLRRGYIRCRCVFDCTSSIYPRGLCIAVRQCPGTLTVSICLLNLHNGVIHE